MVVVDVLNLDHSLRVSKVEFLIKRITLVNKPSSFSLDVHLTAIHHIGNSISKMFHFIHPRQEITTKQQFWKVPWLFEESHQLCLALVGVRICAEL